MELDLRATIAGFAGALVVLAVLAWLVGIADLIAALSGARPSVVAAVVGAAVVWLTAWALALRTVLAALEAPVGVPGAVGVYAGALFANNVTPFGQAGGEPVSALLISKVAHTDYETALAAIASADSLNFVPSTVLALVGLAYVAIVATMGDAVQWATVAVVAIAVAVPAVGWFGWTYRDRLQAGVGRALTPVAQLVGRYVPGVGQPTREAVASRVDGFFRSIEAVATDRRTLLTALGLSTLGWFAQAVALWLSLYAVGVVAPFGIVFVAVPVGAIAGVTPLPGGLGGVEAVLVALLVPLAGISAATAAAAVLVHRGAIYWLPTLVGGGVVAALGARRA